MKLKGLIREYAKEKNIPYKVAFIVIMSTWKEVYDQMGNMDKYHLRVPGLGTFGLKTWKADIMKERAENIMLKHPQVDLTNEVVKLEHVKEMGQQEQERKSDHWERKKQYREQQQKLQDNDTNREDTTGLEE